MTDSKIIKFFEDVVSKTKEGRIPWEPTAQESNFIAPIGGRFSLSISEKVAYGTGTPMPDELYGSQGHYDSPGLYGSLEKYALVLRDMNGRIATVTDANEGIHPGAMRELYEAARWQAVHGGEKLSEALEVLQSL